MEIRNTPAQNRKVNFMRLLGIALLPVAIFSLLYPAVLNGFPFVYSDSGTYLAAAPSMQVPVDRPIGYSLFIQLCSFHMSLWMVVVVQALILYYLIYLIFRDIISSGDPLNFSSLTIILLSITTGVSNYCSQLMPDIFLAIMLLVTIILLAGKKRNRISIILLFIIFQFAVISHYSNLLVASMLLCVMLLLNIRRKLKETAGIRLLLVFTLSGWLLMPAINYFYGAGFRLARTANISPAARLIETGIMRDYLHKNCAVINYDLCRYKDSLDMDVAYFMWNSNSVLYNDGCMERGWGECWIEKDAEFGRLIRDIIGTPEYFIRILKMTLQGTFKQLPDFNVGMMESMPSGSSPWSAVQKHYKNDLIMFENAKQFHHNIYFPTETLIQRIMVCGTLLFLLILALRKKTRTLYSGRFGLMFLLVMLCILFNAFICATLSSPVDRYEARIIWLLPLLAFVALPFLVPGFRKNNEPN